jgi:hypothetical protein
LIEKADLTVKYRKINILNGAEVYTSAPQRQEDAVRAVKNPTSASVFGR